MRFLLVTALKDIRRRLADPAALLIWMGLPVVIGSFMNLVSGGGDGPTPKAHVLIADEDGSFISQLLTTGGGGPAGQFLETERVTTEEGRRKMDAGEATALLIIPKGFQDAVLRERPTELTLLTNPSQRILPGIVAEGLKMAVEAAFYAQRIFGQPLQEIADVASRGTTTGPSDDVVAAISRVINQRLRALEGTLAPPVFTLETKAGDPAQASAAPSFGMLFLPGLLFMALLFTAQGVSIDIWIEKTHGTLRRALGTPQPASAFLAGKVAAGVTIMAMAVVVALILGVAVLKAPIGRVPLALVWTCFSGAALLCYLLLVQLLSTSARGAQLLSALIVFPLIMIGGSFFPFEAMPDWMVGIGRWTPNGLAVMQVKQILFGQIDWRDLLTAAAGIGLPAAAAFALCVRRLNGAFGTT